MIPSRFQSFRAVLCFLLLTPSLALLGNEKAAFPTATWEDVINVKNRVTNSTVSYRQDICERYERVQNGEVRLRDALQGMQLRPLMRVGKFFPYTEEKGIDPLDPGLLALMMDELGRRAGFTWRDSFAVVYGLPEKPEDAPEEETVAFTDLLLWSTETYDLSCNWWDQTIERLELGISFLQPWFDGSIIMVQKEHQAEVDDDTVDVWNWLRPFSVEVWMVTVATIFFSGVAYSWLEHLSGHKRDRSFWQWFSDNLYLSAIAFPQNYEFEPRSAAARIFGISISFWALVMTATYTANLASLLVDTKAPRLVVESITDAVTLDIPVCVYENTGADTFIKTKYRQARRIPFGSELETYQGLQEGQCDITLAYYQNWLGFASQKEYNPYCDLEWVGRTIKTIRSGFASNGDVGNKCTNLISQVLDIYLNELLASGFIEDMWDQHYDKSRDINCDAVSPEILQEVENPGRLRRLTNPEEPNLHDTVATPRMHSRQLKAGKRGGAAGVAAVVGGEVQVDASQMTLNQMAGTFILHYWVTAVAIIIGYLGRHYKTKEIRISRMYRERSSKFMKRGITSRWRRDSCAPPQVNALDNDTGAISSETTGDQILGDGTEDSKVSFELPQKGQVVEDEAKCREEQGQEGQAQNDILETKRELLETKRELQQTREEVKNQMDFIVKLLMENRKGSDFNASKGSPYYESTSARSLFADR